MQILCKCMNWYFESQSNKHKLCMQVESQSNKHKLCMQVESQSNKHKLCMQVECMCLCCRLLWLQPRLLLSTGLFAG